MDFERAELLIVNEPSPVIRDHLRWSATVKVVDHGSLAPARRDRVATSKIATHSQSSTTASGRI